MGTSARFPSRILCLVRGGVKLRSIGGCLTDIGVSARDLVVGLPQVERRSDALFDLEHPGADRVREAASNLLTGGGKLVEGYEGVPDHGIEVERAGRLIQGPESFCTVGIELEQLMGLRLRKIRR